MGKVELTRRIAELMHEKGEAYSIRAFAARIGISRELLRLCLVGERPITPSTLEKISKGLGLTVERLKQIDTDKMTKDLNSLWKAKKRSKTSLLRALDIAQKLVSVAKGVTERAFSLSTLGRVQFELQQYDDAHESLQRAFEYAEKVHELYADSTLLHLVTSYLMVSYTVRKEYTNILQTLNIVEGAFADDPEKMGYAHYTRMKWYEHRGDLALALKHSYLALEFFDKTQNTEQIGKALINVAHFESLTGNYRKSKASLSTAMTHLQSYNYFYLIAVKEYVKTLLQLNEYAVAGQIIEEHVEAAQEYPDLYAKLQILYTIASDDPTFAEKISSDLKYSMIVRGFACKQLMRYYSTKDDAESVMRYYKFGQMITNKRTKFFDEEGF